MLREWQGNPYHLPFFFPAARPTPRIAVLARGLEKFRVLPSTRSNVVGLFYVYFPDHSLHYLPAAGRAPCDLAAEYMEMLS